MAAVVWQETKAQNNPQPQPPRRSFAEIVNMPVVYTVPGMNEVRIKKDVVYKSVENSELKMDVYTPPNLSKGEKRAAVFFIHGGTQLENRPKDWGVFQSWGKLVGASGMVGVVFTHRMGFPKPEMALAENDLNDAINYVRNNAEALSVDKDRIALVAFSAGAPLLSVPMRDTPPFVRALAAFYGFLDIQQSEMHRRGVGDAQILKKYSPFSYLAPNAAKLPPIFIARAGRDEIPGLNDAADRFIAEALSKNVSIEVMNHPAGVHGFDNQTDDGRSREIIRRALEFLRANLEAPKTSKLR
ncbi:MAG: alpha/beta hydrolase [Acidobacteriota bacterium]|nr:alpha/beta hydrolase [Acidobacteriota bacterium]